MPRTATDTVIVSTQNASIRKQFQLGPKSPQDLSQKRLSNAYRRRGHTNFFPRQGNRRDHSHFGTLIQSKLDSRNGFDGSNGSTMHQQHLFKGSNFSQVSRLKKLTNSIGLQAPSDCMSGQNPQRVLSASNKTHALTGGQVRSNVNTTALKASHPAHEYLGFTTIKSWNKSDRLSKNQIQNSISSECLNAQKIVRRSQYRGEIQSFYKTSAPCDAQPRQILNKSLQMNRREQMINQAPA